LWCPHGQKPTVVCRCSRRRAMPSSRGSCPPALALAPSVHNLYSKVYA
jgi:hypothetical protein